MKWYQKVATRGMISSKVTDKAKVLKYLSDTDWYIVRKAETDVDVPQEVLDKRAECRELLNA